MLIHLFFVCLFAILQGGDMSKEEESSEDNSDDEKCIPNWKVVTSKVDELIAENPKFLYLSVNEIKKYLEKALNYNMSDYIQELKEYLLSKPQPITQDTMVTKINCSFSKF